MMIRRPTPPAGGNSRQGGQNAKGGNRRNKGGDGRAHQRVLCSEDTHFSTNRRLFEGTLKNLSAGGTYIQTRGHFIVGQEIVVAGIFESGGAEEKRYGKVVRMDGNGIGVQFVRKDPLLGR